MFDTFLSCHDTYLTHHFLNGSPSSVSSLKAFKILGLGLGFVNRTSGLHPIKSNCLSAYTDRLIVRKGQRP